ncbi:hypothetical protein [Amantichitinum ursilacus]|uniref:Uncharacterized protein n=1 Tax=Amantichitinum ursilacus TaxID=857265 RepID=A0A0N0XL83_9NEIS|nr:hypothetical protein [Amantichitinum ursilacus]KPC53859.1 hypothetical protein WG78_07045 [Amantichitinum ursilacus]
MRAGWLRCGAALALLPALVLAAGDDDALDLGAAPSPATASVAAALTRPVYIGREGEHPVQVALGFLNEHVSDEHGLFEYQRLQITQLAYSKDLQHVSVTVLLQGLRNTPRSAERYELQQAFVGKTWQITHARQDWKCQRGGWTQRPC